ncbi:Thiol:disulfide interchange protein DsbA precursor [Moraxella catarrhalis]|uniref:thiol:disulfide interchange protein DsbA/DsbL n=1 Tax=Moraxella catarrhalis TaxID=480 RepID=UPI0007B41841|nr:thiol:disulfide interchange protein DsbA/DsbL [Moraxella catarrhalis]ARB66889.1 thiol:disulfide interchange protein DsbA/DsbL [Moraxella catarrhalis]KZR95160.1 disulfide bond formation protein DsbA [Moraxella catarrhalis]SQH70712.1 Thiol:disulfide interchange protein DsbA precursor [Moraxella catarrhalis]
MKFALKTALLTTMLSVATLAQANFVEDQDYKVLPNPETIAGDVIVVREFFWYGCPHCYHLEPHMQKWAKTRPADVAFFQTPAAMNPVWEVGARGFYAAQQLDAQEKTHQALFDAVHKDGNRNIISSQQELGNWYASKGIDKAKFDSLYNSFAVTTKIERAKAAATRYGLSGVPAVVVHGKYVVSGEDAKVPQVVDFLINKVREEKQ